MNALHSVKAWLMGTVHLGKDALHIYVGLIVLFSAAALFRWPLRSWKPWLAVLAAALAGEIWDMLDRVRYGMPQNYWGNWKDVWNTLFWPTALTLLVRYTGLLRR